MASTSSISGLASGLDTDTIITNLMTLEAKPQTLLKTQLSATQAKATAYRAVNTRFDAIRTAAEALSSSTVAAARSATSSSSTVTATATTSATSGSSLTFDVTALATKHSVRLGQSYSSTTAAVTVPAFPLTVTSSDGTKTATISVDSSASLLDVVSAVNASSYGMNATVVQLGDGTYRLQIGASNSGAANAFTLTDANGATVTTSTTSQGQDATLALGNGDIATSSSNTFSNLLTGTSVTVSKVESEVTVSVGSDTSSLSSKVSALVSAVNGALGLIKGYTTSEAGSDVATLQSDRSLITLTDQVLDAFSTAVGGYGSLAQLGIQLNSDGTVKFDSTTFATALAANPDKVKAMVSGTAETTTNGVTTAAVPGIATRIAAIAKSASDSSTGTLVLLANGRDTLADGIQDKIDNWTTTLEKRKATLTAQFTALETALSALKTQSSWLTSQVAQLYNPNASS